MTRAPLTVDSIVAAAWELSHGGDAEAVSLRDLGASLGVHPTAIYRHFRDKHELMCAVADRTMAGVADAADGVEEPRAALTAVLLALRATLLAHPAAARVLAEGPTRRSNEVALTERMLALLRTLGLADEDVVEGYHALIELTVGSAVIDQTVHALPDDERERTYRHWRADYLGLDADRFPHLVELAPRMYGHAAGDFAFGLNLLLDSLARRASSRR
jgi:TetR/AcrR family transcriptional regulator, tetracycline repressor protein